MITFSKIGEYGRLGNQMFQYALLKSVSMKTNFEITLPTNLHNRVWHGQQCKLKIFKLPSATYSDIKPKFSFNEGMNQNRDYLPSVYEVSDGTDFFGFFQNINYYKEIRKELLNEFELDIQYEDFANEYLSKFNNPTVSLHVRRGDVSDGTNRNASWSNDYSDTSILKTYHEKALKEIPENSTILLFTGGSRKTPNYINDLEWCKQNIKDERIIYVDNLNDIESFSIMKNVDYNITSFNSTFSWWASYLNKNENIISPDNFLANKKLDNNQIYPDYWKII